MTAIAKVPLTTMQVADLLGVTYWTVYRLIQARRIHPPPQTGSGEYLWGSGDIEAARQVIEARRRAVATVA